MRKWYAVILFFPLMSLMAGAVWLPSHCPMAVKTQCPKAASTQCPMMARMDHKTMMAMMLRHKLEAEKKAGHSHPEQKNGDKKECGGCIDCPVFYMVTFKPVIRFECLKATNTQEYTIMPGDNLSDYSFQKWKPPDCVDFS